MDYPAELLKAAAITNMEWHQKTHLVNQHAVRDAKFLGNATGMTDLGFQVMRVMPGHEYAEYHRHLYEEQCFYILSGQGEVIIEERGYPLETGDFLGFPKSGVAHTIINSGTEPLILLSARVNLEQDVCDYPRKKKRLYMNGAEEALVDFESVRVEKTL